MALDDLIPPLDPKPACCDVMDVAWGEDKTEFQVAVDRRDKSMEGVYVRGLRLDLDAFQPYVLDELYERACAAIVAQRRKEAADRRLQDRIDADKYRRAA